MPDRRWLLAALLVFAACDGPGAEVGPEVGPPAAPRDTDPEALRGGPGVPVQLLVEAGRSRGPGGELLVLDTLEEPRRIETREVPNRHDPERTDILRSWYYEGLSFTVYEVSSSGRELMQRVEITGDEYRTADGLRVGMTREAVVGIRGQPSRVSGSTAVYELGGQLPAQLRVSYGAEGTVRKLTWVFPID